MTKMGRIGGGLFLFFYSMTLSASTLVDGRTKFDWATMSSADLKVTADPMVEDDFRLHIVRNAKKSIHLLTFDQRACKKVGMPLLRELGRAASRGVKVDVVTAWGGRAVLDPEGWSSQYIRFLDRKYPGVFRGLVAGGPAMKKRGWNFSDGTHIKLLVVDGHIAIVTGRGNAEKYLHWLDTAFIFKGQLVQDSEQAFQDIWERLLIENPPKNPGEGSILFGISGVDHILSWMGSFRPTTKATLDEQEAFWEAVPFHRGALSTSRMQKKAVRNLIEWASDSSSSSSQGKPIQVRLLRNNFMQQMADQRLRPEDISIEKRTEFLKDDIVDAVVEQVNRAKKKIRFFTFATIMHPKFKKALIRAARRGVDVQVLTNSKQAHKKMVGDILYHFSAGVIWAPEAVGYYIGLKDSADLLNAGIRVYGLRPEAKDYETGERTPNPYEYLHRKILSVDDHVFFGSHNLTIASTTLQEEFNYQIVDSELAAWIGEEFTQNTMPRYAKAFDRKTIDSEVHKIIGNVGSQFRQWLYPYFSFLY